MPTTLTPGQLVVQNRGIAIGRIWRLDRPLTGAANTWRCVLVENPDPRSVGRRAWDRLPGNVAVTSVEWLTANCADWAPPTVDPPIGDGVQCVAVFGVDGTQIEFESFDTASAAVEWLSDALTRDRGEDEPAAVSGAWWGYDNNLEPPDMTVTATADGALVWAETSV